MENINYDVISDLISFRLIVGVDLDAEIDEEWTKL